MGKYSWGIPFCLGRVRGAIDVKCAFTYRYSFGYDWCNFSTDCKRVVIIIRIFRVYLTIFISKT